jgi:sugar/nucleoside kinase (ribokinase family)
VYDLISLGALSVEFMRPSVDMPLDEIHPFLGPFPSGSSAITISTAARLGLATAFIGVVGADLFGDVVYGRLREDGVDMSSVVRWEGLSTRMAFVMYRADGSRTFNFVGDSSKVNFNDSRFKLPGSTRWLHLSGTLLAANSPWRPLCELVLSQVLSQGGSLSFDPNFRPETTDLATCRTQNAPYIQQCRYFLPSKEELLAYVGTQSIEHAVETVLGLGPEVVVVKCGAEGCLVADLHHGISTIPGFVVDCIDPTGAGDSFNAAFICARERGLGLEDSGLFANAVGAFSTTRRGPMEGSPYPADLQAFLVERGFASLAPFLED